ncbi:unnamed protein product, partial [Rotaria sp. Silwood2]
MPVCRLNAENPVLRAPLLFIFIITFLCFLIFILHEYVTRVKHGVREIGAKQYQCFSTLSDNSDDFRLNLLRPLLIERVSGTSGNAKARQFIMSKLQSTNMWNIELDTFDEMTPDGNVEFTNIVATLDPTASRRLVLAYSAVPCAILLDLAINLQKQLNELKKNKGKLTLQLLFFDGEEAVRDWSSTDSLYGS